MNTTHQDFLISLDSKGDSSRLGNRDLSHVVLVVASTSSTELLCCYSDNIIIYYYGTILGVPV